MKSTKARRARHAFLEEMETWPSVVQLALSETAARAYNNKFSALRQYAEGASLDQINATTGYSRQGLYWLLDHCAKPHPDGRPMGARALVSGTRSALPSKLTALSSGHGRPVPWQLTSLFQRSKELRKIMEDAALHGLVPGSKRPNPRLTMTALHSLFMEQCDKLLNIRAPQFPFNSDSQGQRALCRWVKKVREQDVQRRMHDAAVQLENDPWRSPSAGPSRCFERVECDGHYIDVQWILECKSLTGEGIVKIRVSRLWLIALIEVKSGAVLGYTVAYGLNYAADDICRALHSALVPWKPRELSMTTIAYKEGEGLPNAIVPELAYACCEELWVDNAKAHLSSLFMSSQELSMNATLVFGAIGNPNSRPRIEGLFDLLEEAGIHVLDGTTGSHHKDARKAKKEGDHLLLNQELLLDLVDLLIARWNTGISPGTSLSRMEVLRRFAQRETAVLRRIPEKDREALSKHDVFEMAEIGTERGRPILRWRNARYSGPGLSSRPGLIGQEVLVMANSKDVTHPEVVLTSDGTSLGVFEVERRWRTPHSLQTRRQVRRHMSNNGFLKHAADIPRAARAQLEVQAHSGRGVGKRLSQLATEQGATPGQAANGRTVAPPTPAEATADPPFTASAANDNVEDTQEVLLQFGAVYR